ncbi:MAG: low temperature requirement protein A [Gemmatimonadales bacterium]
MSTPLELFFDLVFVVAIAGAAAGLHHAIGADHALDGLQRYLRTFFAIWWAWMNFTWFASAYDCDDVPYRIVVFVQLTGALIMAAGASASFDSGDATIITFGYVVMRVAMVTQWLRAGAADPATQATARRYAIGIAVVQVGWVALLLVPPGWGLPGFLILAAAELAVPVWAERAALTPWHPHHIAERYGLFTIIVLGESVLAASRAIQVVIDAGALTGEMIAICGGGLLIVFALWWLYFDEPGHASLTSFWRAFAWGYGHYLVFAAAAAVGAGLAVVIDRAAGRSTIAPIMAGMAVAIPVAVYILSLWMLRFRHRAEPAGAWLGPMAAAAVLATPVLPHPTLALGVLLAGLVGWKVIAAGPAVQ